MQIVYAGEPLPTQVTKTIFLAGPSPRGEGTPSWRPEALALLEQAGFDGHVFLPERRDGCRPNDYVVQKTWELDAQNMSDVILFWIPREMSTMPALTTNNEYGSWSVLDPTRVFLGAPQNAQHVSYQFSTAADNEIPTFNNLGDLVNAVIDNLGAGAERQGGACQVPMHIWLTPSFQHWYQTQTKAGIELHGARVKWVFRIGAKYVLYWALKLDMFVVSENRHKTNEVVVARPDVCLTVAWHRPPGAPPEATEFVLIREYRTPAVSDDAFVWENPGGSSFKPGKDPKVTAAEELGQEAGFEVDHRRVRVHRARQIVATLSAHRAHVYSVELTAGEIAALRKLEANGTFFGVKSETERTYPRVRTLQQIREGNFVDWATIGILLTVMDDCVLCRQQATTWVSKIPGLSRICTWLKSLSSLVGCGN